MNVNTSAESYRQWEVEFPMQFRELPKYLDKHERIVERFRLNEDPNVSYEFKSFLRAFGKRRKPRVNIKVMVKEVDILNIIEAYHEAYRML